MKTQTSAEIIKQLEKTKNFPTLGVAQLIDQKVESDMKEVLQRLDLMESKFDAKFNLLTYMIGFIMFVITVVSIITQLKI